MKARLLSRIPATLQSQSLSYSQLCRRRFLSSVKPSRPFDIIFFGRDEFSCGVLNSLYTATDVWKTLCVATSPDRKVGRRGSVMSVSPLKIQSENLGIPVHFIPSSKSAFKTWSLPPPFFPGSDLVPLLITASFGRIIPNQTLNFFPPSRRLNVHPSILPLYRGPAPIQHTIADGKTDTGVCVLEMKEKSVGIDCGELWGVEKVDIPQNPQFHELRNRLSNLGGSLLVDVLRRMMTTEIKAMPQEDSGVSYAPMIKQQTAYVDPNTWDAFKVERMYRAIAHQKPLIFLLPSEKTLQIHDPQILDLASSGLSHKLHALKSPGDAIFEPRQKSLIIRCASDTFVMVPQVKQQDHKLLLARDWWNGIRAEWKGESGEIKLGYPVQANSFSEKSE